MAKKSKYKKFQQSLFSRSARMMSYELRIRREEWEQRKPRRYKRVCEYVMHEMYMEIVVELTEVLER